MNKKISLPNFAKTIFYDLIGSGAAASRDQEPDFQNIWLGLNYSDCAEKVHGFYYSSGEEVGAWIAPSFLHQLETLANSREDVLKYVEDLLLEELQQDDPSLSKSVLMKDDFVKTCLSDSPKIHSALVSFLKRNEIYQSKTGAFIAAIQNRKQSFENHQEALRFIDGNAQEFSLAPEDAAALAAIALDAYPPLPYGTQIPPGLAKGFAASRLMRRNDHLRLDDQDLDQIVHQAHFLLSISNGKGSDLQEGAFLPSLAPVANTLDNEGLKRFAEGINDPDPQAFLDFCLTDKSIAEALGHQALIDHIHSVIGFAMKEGVLSDEAEIAFALHNGQKMLDKAGVDLKLRRASCELFARKAMQSMMSEASLAGASIPPVRS